MAASKPVVSAARFWAIALRSSTTNSSRPPVIRRVRKRPGPRTLRKMEFVACARDPMKFSDGVNVKIEGINQEMGGKVVNKGVVDQKLNVRFLPTRVSGWKK
eukprot:9588114-Ditylum_brightwellii.AAC.1